MTEHNTQNNGSFSAREKAILIVSAALICVTLIAGLYRPAAALNQAPPGTLGSMCRELSTQLAAQKDVPYSQVTFRYVLLQHYHQTNCQPGDLFTALGLKF